MKTSEVSWWLHRCDETREKAAKLVPEGVVIDEVAIAFAHKPSLNDFMLGVKGGTFLTHDHVEDAVLYQERRTGFMGAYRVSYDFVQLPDWRVEAVLAPTSPLHRRFFNNDMTPKVVHVSYKVGSMTEFLQTNEDADKQGIVEEMFCASSYGVFSYRRPASWPLEKVYLKPRLSWETVRVAMAAPKA
jgi:hypothetical protein